MGQWLTRENFWGPMFICSFRCFLSLCFITVLLSVGCGEYAAALTPKSSPGISIPAVFESNLGQASADYRFIARHTDGDVRFTNAGPDFFMQGRTDRAVIQLRPIETTASMRVVGKQLLQASSNYLIGRDPSHWIT